MKTGPRWASEASVHPGREVDCQGTMTSCSVAISTLRDGGSVPSRDGVESRRTTHRESAVQARASEMVWIPVPRGSGAPAFPRRLRRERLCVPTSAKETSMKNELHLADPAFPDYGALRP